MEETISFTVPHADGTTYELDSYERVSCVSDATQKCELMSGDTVELTVLSCSAIPLQTRRHDNRFRADIHP